jgi:hypothetical protein
VPFHDPTCGGANDAIMMQSILQQIYTKLDLGIFHSLSKYIKARDLNFNTTQPKYLHLGEIQPGYTIDFHNHCRCFTSRNKSFTNAFSKHGSSEKNNVKTTHGCPN